VPIMIPLVLAMGIGPMLNWKRGDAMTAMGRVKLVALVAVLAGFAAWLLIDRASALAAFGMGLAAWLLIATLKELADRIHLFRAPAAESARRFLRQPRASWGMTLAHAGLAIGIAGMTASSAWKVENIQMMKIGDQVEVAGFTYSLKAVNQVKGPNYQAMRGIFEVSRGDDFKLILEPEKRVYGSRSQPTTEAAIYPTFFGDLYAVIGDFNEKSGGFVTRIYFNPLVAWMWVGALIMVIGAGISLSDRRHRIGAPSRRSVKGAAATP